MKLEFKDLSIDSKLKVGDIITFMASSLEQGKEIATNATGAAIVSDCHIEDNTYNIVIWQYKDENKAGNGKGAILDIKETTNLTAINDNGVVKHRIFGILGGLRDKNLEDFVAELKEDLGSSAGGKPAFLVLTGIKESNVLDVLREGGMKMDVNQTTGRLEVEEKKC
jgi:hypothetical protein